MGQTQAIYGLAGVGFTDPVDNSYVGFSVTALTLKITGGHEFVEQKNSADVLVSGFNKVASISVEIEGITDATHAMIARLKGGKLRTGTNALPGTVRASAVSPGQWAGTTVAIAAGMTPVAGVYTIEQHAADPIVRRLFTGEGDARMVANADGDIATADFAITTIPAGVVVGDVGIFFLEPVATGTVAEYSFGSLNLPQLVSVHALTERTKTVDAENRNQKRIFIPRLQLNPIDDDSSANAVSALGTISGMPLHDATIAGCYTIAYSYGTS